MAAILPECGSFYFSLNLLRIISMSQSLTNPPLPKNLYTAAQVRALDRCAIDEHRIPGIQLMKRAGRAAFDVLLQRWPQPERIHIVCGTGNNGGDGFIVAALAAERGIPVSVWQVGDAAKIAGDALFARRFAERAGVTIKPFTNDVLGDGVIVDALLGTGLGGDVREPFAAAIAAINSSELPVLAIDIPSGLCSDSGRVLGAAVRAQSTVTFIGLKRGLFTGDAADVCGEIHFRSLDVPAEIYQRIVPACERLLLDELKSLLPPRPRTAHKGFYGHVLVVGGDHGMAGAALMAAMTAGRVGAGLVSCATQPEHVAALVARCPEVMAHGVRSRHELEPLLAKASVIVIGPGLGRSAWSEQMLQRVWEYLLSTPGVAAVVDADALNLLAEGRVIAQPHFDRWILTPHPGEAARLLGVSTNEIQRDRFAAAQQLQQRFGGAVILKGAGTVVSSADALGVSNYGNPGMASGGMGDVLSGVLGGLLAQHLDLADAAWLGTCLHGRAGELAAIEGERGLLATDLLPQLRRLVNDE